MTQGGIEVFLGSLMVLPIWLDTQGGIEALFGSLIALPIQIEHFRLQIVTLHVSWMTQGGIEVLL